jgi:hypothetical protein
MTYHVGGDGIHGLPSSFVDGVIIPGNCIGPTNPLLYVNPPHLVSPEPNNGDVENVASLIKDSGTVL